LSRNKKNGNVRTVIGNRLYSIIKSDGDLTKSRQKQVGTFFWRTLYYWSSRRWWQSRRRSPPSW